jgi:hypothetical protein
MPESLAEHLSCFTPDGTGLDRDALLIAAGRASVRPNRGWVALAGTLAACQLLTLAFLWPMPTPPAGTQALAPPAPAAVELPAPPLPSDAAELWAPNCRLLQSEGGDLPPPVTVDSVVPDDPPLYAFGARSLAGLD